MKATQKNVRYARLGAREGLCQPARDMGAGRLINRFAFEQTLGARGVTRIAGVDEVGRGPLAGPVVAAAAVLPERWVRDGLPADLAGLNDSKQLTEVQRERFFAALAESGEVHFAIAQLDAAQIDRLNILRATHRAMTDALAQLSLPPHHVLVDGRAVKDITLPQTAIVKGDALSYSIAAASVLAKVTRDRLMADYERQFPGYGFAEHKGYGTPQHLEAIARLGPCPIHRRSFAPFKAVQRQLL